LIATGSHPLFHLGSAIVVPSLVAIRITADISKTAEAPGAARERAVD
jgi:hypothetical protein